jgi:hypothetical protein
VVEDEEPPPPNAVTNPDTELILNMLDHENGPAAGLPYQVPGPCSSCRRQLQSLDVPARSNALVQPCVLCTNLIRSGMWPGGQA